MAVGDNVTENGVSSFSLNNNEQQQRESVVSPEDIAWADSCLTKDPLMLENGWKLLEDALLESLETQPDSAAKGEKNGSSEGIRLYTSSSSEDSGNTHDLEKTTISTAFSQGPGPNANNGDDSTNNNADDFWSKHDVKDLFLPAYNENLKDLGISNSEFDFVFQESELEPSTADIFKVWDLDIPPEEDELVRQLNKVLAESTLEQTPQIPDDSDEWKRLKDESLDELISGIADLSLTPSSV